MHTLRVCVLLEPYSYSPPSALLQETQDNSHNGRELLGLDAEEILDLLKERTRRDSKEPRGRERSNRVTISITGQTPVKYLLFTS
jgi:hypothetical protein